MCKFCVAYDVVVEEYVILNHTTIFFVCIPTNQIFPYYSSWHVGWDILSLEVFFKGVVSVLHVFLALIGKHLVVHAPMHWFTVLIKS